MTIRFAKVRLSGRHSTVLLRVDGETDSILTGIEVNTLGEEVAPKGHDEQGRPYDERRHIIDKAAITSRVPMVMNLHYGELEEAR